ncbi:hypothetical protein AVEN_151972-1 [Araneus ventricosus]|uniref:Uncharacterized protein n=1 Tax=Araneus ventricosus TaxID=182803 RepID=A0A4Y2IAC1_ARAVE|nr:hypothetical protein AVEN_151972-1 [Araneus ventricosus]
MKTLEERIRTAKLWLQYFKQITGMHDFMRVERTGDWNLHLCSVQRMLVHLHAAGHIHYAKSAYLRYRGSCPSQAGIPAPKQEKITQNEDDFN